MADHDTPKLNAVGEPEAAREQPVVPHHPDRPTGSRQDDAGVGPERDQRHDATPPGATGDARRGPRQGTGPRDPFEAHRGDPAKMRTGAAEGAGAGAGGGGAGESEEPDGDDASGGGRPQQDRS